MNSRMAQRSGLPPSLETAKMDTESMAINNHSIVFSMTAISAPFQHGVEMVDKQ